MFSLWQNSVTPRQPQTTRREMLCCALFGTLNATCCGDASLPELTVRPTRIEDLWHERSVTLERIHPYHHLPIPGLSLSQNRRQHVAISMILAQFVPCSPHTTIPFISSGQKPASSEASVPQKEKNCRSQYTLPGSPRSAPISLAQPPLARVSIPHYVFFIFLIFFLAAMLFGFVTRMSWTATCV